MSRLPATPTNENAIPEVECDAAGYREHRRKVADKWTNVELLILSFVLFLPYHLSDFRIKIFQEKKFLSIRKMPKEKVLPERGQ